MPLGYIWISNTGFRCCSAALPALTLPLSTSSCKQLPFHAFAVLYILKIKIQARASGCCPAWPEFCRWFVISLTAPMLLSCFVTVAPCVALQLRHCLQWLSKLHAVCCALIYIWDPLIKGLKGCTNLLQISDICRPQQVLQFFWTHLKW